MASKLDRMVTYLDCLLPIKSVTISSRCFAKSRDELRTYLHYHKAYDQKSWQDNDLS